MLNRKEFRLFEKLLVGFLLGLLVLLLWPAAVSSQSPTAASAINTLCRQVNPESAPGLIAYSSPSIENRIDAADGRKDGPGSNEAVYLTSSPPETSADGKYIRVWFDSLDPNYKLGWIPASTNDKGSLKMGDPAWRADNCAN